MKNNLLSTNSHRRGHRGFTVLELLIVLGIIAILIGLVLTSLNAARQHSNDERKVSNLQAIALGLRDYFAICRQYPATLDPAMQLDPSTNCPALSAQSSQKTLGDIIPQAADLHFNGNNPDGSASLYHYASLVTSGGGQDQAACTNFHLWVTLDADGASFASQKSNKSAPYSYGSQALSDCTGTAVPGGLAAQGVQVFDIFK